MIGMIILYVAACISLFIMASAIGNQKQEIAKLSTMIRFGLMDESSRRDNGLRRNECIIKLILNHLHVEVCDVQKGTKLITKKNKQKEGAKDDR